MASTTCDPLFATGEMDVRGGLVIHHVRAASPRGLSSILPGRPGETSSVRGCPSLQVSPPASGPHAYDAAPHPAPCSSGYHTTHRAVVSRPGASATWSRRRAHETAANGHAMSRSRSRTTTHAPGIDACLYPRRGWSRQGHRGSGAGAAAGRAPADRRYLRSGGGLGHPAAAGAGGRSDAALGWRI
jgi:hypothetical protein